MIDIPDTQMCLKASEKGGCICAKSSTRFRSCKFIVPARSPGEQINIDPEKMAKRRDAVMEAYNKVEACIGRLAMTHQQVGRAPLNSAARREQAKAFSELSQAQYELSEAFTFVPPKASANEPVAEGDIDERTSHHAPVSQPLA